MDMGAKVEMSTKEAAGDAWTGTSQTRNYTADPIIMAKIEETTHQIAKKKEKIAYLTNKLQDIWVRETTLKRRFRIDWYMANWNCSYEKSYRAMQFDEMYGRYRKGIEDEESDLASNRKAIKNEQSDLAEVQDYLTEESRKPEGVQIYTRIKELKHEMRNNSLSLREEKKLMQEMKDLQLEREELKADKFSKSEESQQRKKGFVEWKIACAGARNQPQNKWIPCLYERIEELKHKHLKCSIIVKKWRKTQTILDHKMKRIEDTRDIEESKMDMMNKVLLKYQKMQDETIINVL